MWNRSKLVKQNVKLVITRKICNQVYLYCEVVTLSFDLWITVNAPARRRPVMDYICMDFGVDSSSHFTAKEHTHCRRLSR